MRLVDFFRNLIFGDPSRQDPLARLGVRNYPVCMNPRWLPRRRLYGLRPAPSPEDTAAEQLQTV